MIKVNFVCVLITFEKKDLFVINIFVGGEGGAWSNIPLIFFNFPWQVLLILESQLYLVHYYSGFAAAAYTTAVAAYTIAAAAYTNVAAAYMMD